MDQQLASRANNTVTDPTQNPSSVYYLHPSDSASARLVSIVFDDTSFSD